MAKMDYLGTYSKVLEDEIGNIITAVKGDSSDAISKGNPYRAIGDVFSDGETTILNVGVCITIDDCRITNFDLEEFRRLVKTGLAEFTAK